MSNLLEQIEEIQKNIREIKGTWGNTIMTLDNIKSGLKSDVQKRVDEAYQKGYKDCETRYCSFDACPNRQAEYQRGLDDAWEAARKIADMWTRIDNDELLAIFGITERIGHSTINSLFQKQTANEAMLKLEVYEEQKADDEIDEKINSFLDCNGYAIDEVFNRLKRMKGEE